jgi:hypothetical protein
MILVSLIDQRKAKVIARKFLEQYHSTITIESVFLENEIWIVSAYVGLINKQFKKILINHRGTILGYTDKELPENSRAIKNAMILLAIEKALLEIGKPTYEIVVKKLYQKYHCYISDCYEYPEPLNKVLKEIFGNNYTVIVDSIEAHLKDLKQEKPIGDFLSAISK